MTERSDEHPYLRWSRQRVGRELAAKQSVAESRILYTNDEGLPILRDSWVAYLDRLGTSETMTELDDDQLRADLELFDRLRWFLSDEAWNEHNRILSFSDNVVLGEPIVADDELLQAGMLIDSVAGYQLNLAARGRFIRGGIARGPLYMDARYVTGQALITAYTLEHKHADVPRVILSNEIAVLIIEDCAKPPLSRRWSWDSVLVDQDGRMFVNYLPVIADDEIPGEIERGLHFHQQAVENGLRLPPHRRKYEWVAAYHNHICDTVFPDLSRFRVVDPDVPPVQFSSTC